MVLTGGKQLLGTVDFEANFQQSFHLHLPFILQKGYRAV